jgi:hypothetical protein
VGALQKYEFCGPMISESSIDVPLVGWHSREGSEHTWISDVGDVLTLHYFSIPPDLPAALSDLDAIRRHYREVLGGQGAIVETEAMMLDTLPALRTIMKIAQQPSGMTYVAGYTIPFRDCSFVARVQCVESGITGARDAAVAIKLDMHGSAGWRADPYLPRYRNSVLRNKSDDAEWDALFPNHPLSRARRHLEALSRLSLSADVKALAPFTGPPTRPSFLRRLLGRD